jgi:SAM-dependent methyltransferase
MAEASRQKGPLKRWSGLMKNVTAYRLWQSSHAAQKFAPIRAHTDLHRVRRVLDVGCGPGSNAHHFADAEYLGVDLNEDCIEYARRRYPAKTFVVADIRDQAFKAASGTYDFVLVNSVLHHLDLEDTRGLLSNLSGLVAPDGHIHVIELVLPRATGVPRFLAQNDRGDYPRALSEWHNLFVEHFETVVFEPFTLGVVGVPLLELVYFKGKSRAAR